MYLFGFYMNICVRVLRILHGYMCVRVMCMKAYSRYNFFFKLEQNNLINSDESEFLNDFHQLLV